MKGKVAVVAVTIAVASAPVAVAGDHETIGGGSFQVGNSEGPCTDFQADHLWFNVCDGQQINIPFSKYIVVPLGQAAWVGCATYAPNGQKFEESELHAYEVPEMQQFWTERGWGYFEPQVLCQMW